MPILANLLISLITGLIGWFGRFMVIEKAFRLSAVLLMLTLAGVMMGVFSSCAKGVCAQGIASISSSHQGFAVGLGIAFNGTTLGAAAAYMTVWLACQLYVFQKKALNIIIK